MKTMMVCILAVFLAVATTYVSAQEPVTSDPSSRILRRYLPEEIDQLSSERGQKTAIVFVNRLDESVFLYWMRDDGEEMRFGSLAGGDTTTAQTFDGRVWIAKNDNGRTIGAFRAHDQTAHALIESDHRIDANPTERAFTLQIPMSGIELVDWVVGQYFDHDPSAGKRDYRGGEVITRDGHDGIDFNVPNFHWMDIEELQVFVLAAADGRVTAVHDGEYDRNISCSGQANFVRVGHPNGFTTKYYHLKNGSIEVSDGQEVVAGQPLGIVGSSGCSKAPHLHFEVVNENGSSVDPFLEGLWEDPPSYDFPISVMAYNVLDRRIERGEAHDPDPSITSISPGEGVIGMGLSLANVRKGYVMEVVLRNGAVDRFRYTFERDRGHLFLRWWRDVNRRSGTWVVEVYFNEEREPAVRHEVRVASR